MAVAQKLADSLNREVDWALPPIGAKDVRKWLQDRQREESNPVDLVALGRRFSAQVSRLTHGIEARSETSRVDFLDSSALLDADFQQSWLVHHVLVQGQPAIVGGAKKTLKTSLLVDLAVSIATGRPFLEQFRIEQQHRVGLISGESGGATIRETFLRVCRAKHVHRPAAVGVYWNLRMPRLSNRDDLDELTQQIHDHGLRVVIIDPLYLGLLSGSQDVQASNLYQIGPLLADIARACLEAGATPILAHHTKKQPAHAHQPPELEDLAFAGVQEFARQWLLIGRRENYEPGSGEHRLWLNVGGSAGHSGCWAVDVEEGHLRDDFTGRRWVVHVRTAMEERQAVGDRREQTQRQRQEQQEQQDRVGMIQALERFPEGETYSCLRDLAGLPGTRANRALESLVEEGIVERTQIEKQAGRGTRMYDAYRLVATDASCAGASADNEDEQDDCEAG